MLLVSINHIPGKDFEVLGMVKGCVVQSKNFGKDFMAGMKTLVGGEIKGYTEMLVEARQIATKRMVDEAEAMGADAVIFDIKGRLLLCSDAPYGCDHQGWVIEQDAYIHQVLEQGIDPEWGLEPAAAGGSVEVFNLLLEQGCTAGEQELAAAAEAGSVEIVKLLLAAGGDAREYIHREVGQRH